MESIDSVVNKDQFIKLCGIEVIQVGQGSAKTRMVIGPQHLNGMGNAQGGAIFTLADTAFAAACNSHGVPAVALNVSITFLKAAKLGDTLVAHATEDSLNGKVGSYSIRVTDSAGQVLAVFQGLAYRKLPASQAR